MDRPPFKVLGNPVLLSWAENPPRSRKEVLATRGASKRILALLADDVLASLVGPVQDTELPRPGREGFEPMTGAQRMRLQRLKKVRVEMEETLSLPPGLLVNSATLEKLARMDGGEALQFIETGLKSWQKEAVGEELSRVLSD
jgi:ribonuclease D